MCHLRLRKMGHTVKALRCACAHKCIFVGLRVYRVMHNGYKLVDFCKQVSIHSSANNTRMKVNA